MLKKFVYGPGIDEPICMIDITDSNSVYYYHFDGLGSVAALSNVNGEIMERYSYDVFGEPTITDADGMVIADSNYSNPYMFTGRRLDEETELYYYRFRYYNPEIGRFLQTDPLDYYDSMNLYTYVKNNPLNWIDPYGLYWGEGAVKAVGRGAKKVGKGAKYAGKKALQGAKALGAAIKQVFAPKIVTVPITATEVALYTTLIIVSEDRWNDFIEDNDLLDEELLYPNQPFRKRKGCSGGDD